MVSLTRALDEVLVRNSLSHNFSILLSARFGDQLADVMKNMVMIGEVGSLAKDIELYSGDYANNDSALPRSDGIQDLMVEAQASTDSVNPTANMNAAQAANEFIQQRRKLKVFACIMIWVR